MWDFSHYDLCVFHNRKYFETHKFVFLAGKEKYGQPSGRQQEVLETTAFTQLYIAWHGFGY